MRPKGFVFVVDRETYPVHRDRLFCGVKNPSAKTSRGHPNFSLFGLYADLLSVRKGDIVFFYQMRIDEAKTERGFRGVFKIKSEPFFDTEDIDGIDSDHNFGYSSLGKKVLGKCPECNTARSPRRKETKKPEERKWQCADCKKDVEFQILPNRVLLEPIDLYLDENSIEGVIDDNMAYIDRQYIKEDLPVLWTMLFRKTFGAGRARSISPILPSEMKKLQYILNDQFKKSDNFKNSLEPYKRPASAKDIPTVLETDERGELKLESYLEAWLMKNLDKNIPVLSDYVTQPDLDYFANNLLFGIGGEKVDIITTHENNDKTSKVNVIELKKGEITLGDVEQVLGYTKWIYQLIFNNDDIKNRKKIQPILIGFNFSNKLLAAAKDIVAKTETMDPVFLRYCVNESGKTISFDKVEYTS